MQDRNKHIRIDRLVSNIVDRLHARQPSKATGHSRTLKVIRTFQEPTTNPPKRDEQAYRYTFEDCEGSHDWLGTLARCLNEITTRNSTDALPNCPPMRNWTHWDLKAVDASPKELAKILFEIAPKEFGCLKNAERAMEAAIQKAEREMEILANHPTTTRH